jgi:hypothetical protein
MMGRTFGTHGGDENMSVGKPEGKRPLERPRCRYEYNIKMYPENVGCDGVDWNHLAHIVARWRDFVNTVMNLRVPLKTGNYLTS